MGRSLVSTTTPFYSLQLMCLCPSVDDIESGRGGGGSRNDKRRRKSATDDSDDAVTRLIDYYSKYFEKHGGFFGDVGLGTILGACSGYSLKKVGKAAALLIGCGFVATQTASHLGYVNISWKSVENGARDVLDINNDGKLDKEDAKLIWKKFKKIMMHNVPGGGSFAAAFALGFYYG